MRLPPLVWETAEHEHAEKSADWYWIVGLITFACAAASMILSNALFAILIFLSGFSLMLHAHGSPKAMRFEINRHGIVASHHLYPYDTIESFWIHEETHPRRLVLKSNNKMFRHTSIPLGEMNHDAVRNRLLPHIPEIRHEISLGRALVEYIDRRI